MQTDNLLWLVPVVAGVILVYLLVEIGRFYYSIRMWPWQLAADKRRQRKAMAELETDAAYTELQTRIVPTLVHGVQVGLRDHEYHTEIGTRILAELGDPKPLPEEWQQGIEHAYNWHAAQRLQRRRSRVMVIVILVIAAVLLVLSMTSCGFITGASQHPYGKSYDQNNPTCSKQRPRP